MLGELPYSSRALERRAAHANALHQEIRGLRRAAENIIYSERLQALRGANRMTVQAELFRLQREILHLSTVAEILEGQERDE